MTFFDAPVLLAQETTPPPVPAEGAEGEAPPSPKTWPFFVLMIVIMYFVMIRPQQKRAKEQRQRVESMKIGSKIISAGGIHGMVTNVTDKTITVKVSDNTKIKFEKASIAQVFPSDKDKAAADSDSKTDEVSADAEVEAEVISEKKS